MSKKQEGLGKAYWKYWTASSLSMAASNILQYILSLYVLEITGSGTLFASMLSVIIFPRLFLTPIAGVIADRKKKTSLMSLTLLFEAVVLGIYFIIGLQTDITVLLIFVLVVLLEIGEIFYGGASAAIIPELVEEERIPDAVSMSKVDDGIVVVISPMVAALIYENVELHCALLLVAVLNLVACVLQKMIKMKDNTTGEKKKQKRKSIWEDFKEGIVVIKQDQFLRVFIKVLPVVNAFFGATFSVCVMYLLREEYQLDAYAYGIYCTVTATMSLIVPLFAVKVVNKYSSQKIFSMATLLIGIEIAGIGMLAFAGATGILPVMMTVVLITILDCMTIAEAIPMQMASSVLLQTGVSKELLGRVSSAIRMVSTASIALGEILFGVLVDVTAVWLPILIASIMIMVASLKYHKSLK